MSRDLTRETFPANGGAAVEQVGLPGDDRRDLRHLRSFEGSEEAGRDRWLARMGVMLIDTARMLDPITKIVVARVLAVLALLAASGLAVYTVSLTTSWERVATTAVFLAFAGWLVKRSSG